MIRVGLGLHEKRLSTLFRTNWTSSCNVGEGDVEVMLQAFYISPLD
jgi:hypothetical protein